MDNREATERFYAEIWPHRATVLRTARYFEPAMAENHLGGFQSVILPQSRCR